MAIDNSITFGGVNSADYGIYIGGEGVFNAPDRDVEMISIPGRNGSFALDKGRFENIKVTYSAFNYEADLATFSANLDAFRNALCAQSGYQRLTDTFHPDEYRMAAFIGGLEIKPIEYNTASKFDIVFDCKPQRWLTSGETAVTVADGETLTNPTRFGSSPLIRCKGYGQIAFGGAPIKVEAVPIGDVLLANAKTVTITNSTNVLTPPPEIARVVFDASTLNTGDSIYLSESYVKYNIKYRIDPALNEHISQANVEEETGANWSTRATITSEATAYFNTTIGPITFEKGTAETKSYYFAGKWRVDGAGFVEVNISSYINVVYDGNQTITLYASTKDNDTLWTYTQTGFLGQINGYSTIIIDDDVVIDLDIGEAYFDDASHTSANYSVSIPAELPKLAPGANVVSFDNTFTSMEITPRWWKI